MTQRALARQLGISPQYLNDIERGHRSPAHDALLSQVSQTLGIALDYLYFLVGKLPPDLREYDLSVHEAQDAYAQMRHVCRFYATFHKSSAEVMQEEVQP
jgi:transcriptional regulator with XRE-family HTH domain